MMRAIPAAAFLALTTGTLLSACNRPADPVRMAAVEGLIQETENMRTELDGADTNALRHMQLLFEAERPGIERRFQDTLTPHEAEVLGNYYHAMAARLPRLLAARAAEQARLDSTLVRLRDLHHDFSAGLMDQARQDEALAMERRWATALRQALAQTTTDGEQLSRDRRQFRAGIDSILRP